MILYYRKDYYLLLTFFINRLRSRYVCTVRVFTCTVD